MPDKELSKRVISRLIKADGRKDVEIARDLDISSQRLGQYKNGNRFPDAEFIHLWQDKFGQNIMDLINTEETNVSYETLKGTHAKESTDNKQNEMEPRETFYRDLIEGNDEYSLMPRAVLKDYKIVPERILDVIIKSADSEKQALIEKHELIIDGLKNKIKRLESEKEELQRQIPAKDKS